MLQKTDQNAQLLNLHLHGVSIQTVPFKCVSHKHFMIEDMSQNVSAYKFDQNSQLFYL